MTTQDKYGFNLGYIDELYARYRNDPGSVSEAWQEFFADYQPGAAPATPAAPTATASAPTAAPPAPAAAPAAKPEEAQVIVGPAAAIASNMNESLGVPTATSVRQVPVKLLEENRRVINQHQAVTAGAKISFTHLIAWAIVQALGRTPSMNDGFREIEGKPHRLRRDKINLGLAIDIEKRGKRLLMVPNIKDAATFDFPGFVAAYDDLVQRARASDLKLPDFEGTTVTLTNPGMIGTALSVPRLMAGQGTIIGVGSIGYPAEYTGMAPEVISELGLSKIMSLTSTYDHRVIQGAESGAFLQIIGKLMLGEDGFFHRVFQELQVPHEPVLWAGDQNPQVFSSGGNSEAIAKQASVLQLIRAHRVRGHLYAHLNPLGYEPQPHPELELSYYGLSVWDLDRRFISGGLAGKSDTLPLREIVDTIRDTYCRHIGAEFMHITDPEPRNWLTERMETSRNAEAFDLEQQKQILRKLNGAEAFEKYLHTKYLGHKRFSLEGAESLIPMLDFLLQDAARDGVEEVLIGMAHRGRLNVLANTVEKSSTQLFEEFEERPDASTSHGSGDVKYHLGSEGTFKDKEGRSVRVRVASNPSHLEAVDPVLEGIARARQDMSGDKDRERIVPVLIHGDAAFAGQGVVAETLNLSKLKGYRTGGTVHIVVNNQIGFTTGPADARSSMYPTDLAKMVHAPILHVNGDQPEDAVRVIRLAMAYRQRFKQDVVVDLVCYRRWGHNEADDPSYTHPILYANIQKRRSVRKLYTEQLLRRGDIDIETAEKALADYHGRLQEVHDEVKAMEPAEHCAKDDVADDADRVVITSATGEFDTAVDREVLEEVIAGLQRFPEGFNLHPKLGKQLDLRRTRFEQDNIDWALAESLAFGSLVLQGTPVRLSGEDSGRGTFSQRHAVLYDYKSAEPYTSLANLREGQAPFWVYDSLLSEFAVMGFEYGYSIESPETLVMWEAQFGDFVNGAQVIIDQFLASAEAKWGQKSGVVLLLPHGYEGQGPDHSSARVERFLQLAARGNIRVVYPSTPANYFHMLRRQIVDPDKKPLVVLTPKSLLRHKACVSAADELSGGRFQPLIEDPRDPKPDNVRRVLLCSGKVYWDLIAAQQKGVGEDVAIVRLEQLYPYPIDAINRITEKYASTREIVWVQEEPRNMGAWTFLVPRLERCLKPGQELRYVGRHGAPSTATGHFRRHEAAQKMLVERALQGESQPLVRAAQ